MTPTALTLSHLRRHGFIAEVVEKWVPHANRRRDLFGCIDILAIDRRTPGIVGIQATTLGHVADRLGKAGARHELAAWLKAGGRYEVWGWRRRPSGRWEVKVIELRAGDLEPVPVLTPARRGRRPRQKGLFD
jgi:hypothetical protein